MILGGIEISEEQKQCLKSTHFSMYKLHNVFYFLYHLKVFYVDIKYSFINLVDIIKKNIHIA